MGGANPLKTSPLILKLVPTRIPPLIDAVEAGNAYGVGADNNPPLILKLAPTLIPPNIPTVATGNT